jgi:hypothetical protein
MTGMGSHRCNNPGCNWNTDCNPCPRCGCLLASPEKDNGEDGTLKAFKSILTIDGKGRKEKAKSLHELLTKTSIATISEILRSIEKER